MLALLGYFYDWYRYKKYYGDDTFSMYRKNVPNFAYMKFLPDFSSESGQLEFAKLGGSLSHYSSTLVGNK